MAARKNISDLTYWYSNNKSRVIRKRLQEAKNDPEGQYKLLEQDYLRSLIAETENEFRVSNTAKAWKVVNKITNRKTMPSEKLKGKTPEERKEQWFNHFRNLLGTPDTSPSVGDIPPKDHNVNIEVGAFTLKELREAKKQLQNNNENIITRILDGGQKG